MQTSTQVERQISEILKHYDEITNFNIGERKGKLMATIDNISLWAMTEIWHKIKTDRKRLFMPGELDNEFMTIIYMPTDNCTIELESVPCTKVNIKLNLN